MIYDFRSLDLYALEPTALGGNFTDYWTEMKNQVLREVHWKMILFIIADAIVKVLLQNHLY